MHSAALALLAAAALLCAPAATAQKTPRAPKDTACPLELIFPAELLVTQGQPQKATLKVINNGGSISNLAVSYTVESGAPIPPTGTVAGGPWYPGVVVTGASKSSPGAPAPVLGGSPVGKTVSYPTIASLKGSMKLSVTLEAQEGARAVTRVTGTGTYTGPTGTQCTAIINVAATARMAITTRITPKTTATLGGQVYQKYTNVYGLCPKVVNTLASSSEGACATECNNQGKGCTAFTLAPDNTCRTYKASGNQGPQRLTYRYNTTAVVGSLGTVIYVKGTKPRALRPAVCG